MVAQSRPLVIVAAMLFVLAATSPCRAVTVTYVGTESSTGTQNWSNSSVPKSFATGSSNQYGKNGYWQIRPTTIGAANVFEQNIPAGNNLGTSASPFPTLWTGSNPSFISSIQGSGGSYVNFAAYPTFTGPDGTSSYRQGALSVSVGNGPFNTPSGSNNGYFGETLSFTLNYAGTVRVGFAVDSVADGNFAPNYVSVYLNTLGSVYSSALTRDGQSDMAVFDIVNPTGQTFSVSQWQLAGTQNVSAMSLVTFDVIPVPEPSATAVLAAGGIAIGGVALRRRRALAGK